MRASLIAVLLLVAPGCVTLRSHDGKVQKLNDSDPEERFDNLIGLEDEAEGDHDRSVELCEHALQRADDHDSVPVRLVAVRILGKLGKEGIRTKDVAQKLANHARRGDEPDFWCRIEAVDALGALLEGPQNEQPEEAVRAQVHEALLVALSSELEPDQDVRIHAARELALLRPDEPKVLAELVDALSDETADVRHHAQRALIAIAGGDHGPTQSDWQRWLPDETRALLKKRPR